MHKWNTGALPAEYLAGIDRDTRHHAPTIHEVWMTLATAVPIYADRWRIRVGRSHPFGKVLSMEIDGVLYTLTYRKPRIVLLKGNLRGRIVATFVNGSAVREVFEGLRREHARRAA